MTNLYRTFGVIIGLGYLLLTGLWKNMPVQVEWGFCIFLLATLGIPHGAADHLVANQLARTQNKAFNIYYFIFKYISVMIAYGVLWFYFPLISFIIFIGISVFHFGDLETTFISKKTSFDYIYYLQLFRSLILGMGILGFILSQHAEEVLKIVQNFNLGIQIPFDALPISFYIVCMLFGFQKEHTSYFINTGMTLLIGTFLPILPAFMIYFACCHSVYSLRVLSRSLEVNMKTLYIRLLPFTFLAFISGITYIMLISAEKWLAHSFIFLSILTLPHFFLMHKIIPKRL